MAVKTFAAGNINKLDIDKYWEETLYPMLSMKHDTLSKSWAVTRASYSSNDLVYAILKRVRASNGFMKELIEIEKRYIDRVISGFASFCYNYFEKATSADVIQIITDYNNLANVVYTRNSMETKKLINQVDRVLRDKKKSKKSKSED